MIYELIQRNIPDLNNYITGYALLSGLLDKKYTEYPYGIVFGRKLDDRVINSVTEGPTPDYYHHYRKVNNELSTGLHQVSKELKKLNIAAKFIEPTINEGELNDQYAETLRLDFSHKMVATRAGLGWIGKTGLLISREFGPRLRLATILTNYPVNYCKTPVNESKCGNCKLCVDRCPAKAASGKLWNIHIDRDEFYDPFKCREMCRELAGKNISAGTSICGICIAVCPAGRSN